MEKIEQLFIRACKVHNTNERLVKLYKRFYLAREEDHTLALMSIMVDIVDRHAPITASRLLSNMSEQNSWRFADKKAPYEELALSVLISHLRFTAASDFVGLTKPARYR